MMHYTNWHLMLQYIFALVYTLCCVQTALFTVTE